MFGRVYNGPTVIELRYLAPKGSELPVMHRWSRSVNEVAGYVENDPTTRDMYYGVLPRYINGKSRKDINEAACFWVDIDCKDVGGIEDAYEALSPENTCFGYPSITVESGHGLHAYWLLDSVCTDIDYVERVNKGLSIVTHADPVAHDAPRVLRLPGSWNKKDPARPKRVRVTEYRPLFYRPEDFKHFQVSIANQRKDKASIIDEQYDLNSLLKRTNDKFRDLLINGKTSDYAGDYKFDRDRIDCAVACYLLGNGLSVGQVSSIFKNKELAISSKFYDKPEHDRDRYLRKTINKALWCVSED